MNRSAIMKDAHRLYRQSQQLGTGLTFGECLAWAWRKAKARRSQVVEFRTAPRSAAGYRTIEYGRAA